MGGTPRRRIVLLLCAAVAGVLLAAPGSASAATKLSQCTTIVQCGYVTVPIDRSGATPGTLQLYVEEVVATPSRGTMFLVAGGPGQASAQVFNLQQAANDLTQIFPGYTLVAVDDRGTGKSGALHCDALQNETQVTVIQEAQYAAQCAAQIGPTRQFYATRDHAEDLESVRQALGLDKISIWGTSYGTKEALAYALAHPDHVDRLLLDSVLDPVGPDPYARDVLQEMTKGLASICPGTTCGAVTGNFASEVVKLANQLEAKPIKGQVHRPKGKTASVRADGVDFLSMVIQADLNPGLGAELPAAVHAALAGDPRPLLRLVDMFNGFQEPGGVESFSAGLYAATTCSDGHFAWDPSAPIDARQASVNAAIAALPPDATGPFGRWATDFGTSVFCSLWPPPAGNAPLGPGPLPNVPVLVLSGDVDMRTPTAEARRILAGFPQGQLAVVPGVGHSVLTADLTGCATKIVGEWLDNHPLETCPRGPAWMRTVSRFATSLAAEPAKGAKGKPGRTATAVIRTIQGASASWLIEALAGPPGPVAGLAGGTLIPDSADAGFNLNHFSDVPGVDLTGHLTLLRSSPILPLRFVGSVKVSGKAAAAGTVTVTAKSARGKLGGVSVTPVP